MGDNKQYRRTGDRWIANIGGCGCGGRKTTAEADGVDNTKLLIFTSIAPVTYSPANFPGLQYSYLLVPNTVILDLAPNDYELFKANASFRVPIGSEVMGLPGMKARQV